LFEDNRIHSRYWYYTHHAHPAALMLSHFGLDFRYLVWRVSQKNIELYETGFYMDKELCFISVIGQDRKGIIATIANYLYHHNINIEDLSQKIMSGYFVMTMLVDTVESNVPMETLRKDLAVIGENMNLKIQIQHQNIFNAMHRV
jgi:ACT domain-containing protein